MIKAHKIRLNPTPEQEAQLWTATHNARFVYNWGLDRWWEMYKAGERPTVGKLKKELNQIKKEQFPWLMESSKSVMEYALIDLKRAFTNMFEGRTTKVNFKSRKKSTPSFGMANDRVRLDGHNIKLQKIDGWINMTESLRFEGKLMSVRISFYGGYWWASVSVDIAYQPEPNTGDAIGIDLGLKHLIFTSEGEIIENQTNLRIHLKRLRKLNKALSRKVKGSVRWHRCKDKITRLHYKISCLRKDYIHKVTTYLASTYGFIGIENLNVKGMAKNRKLALSISDAALGEIKRQLEYKVRWFGSILQEVDRFFASSKIHHACGWKNEDLRLSDRVWTCGVCGSSVRRDKNAALNIRDEALRLASL